MLELLVHRGGADSNYEGFNAVARVARNAGVTPYNVDKLFWLIGSATSTTIRKWEIEARSAASRRLSSR